MEERKMAYNAANEVQEEIVRLQKNQRGDYLVVKKVTNKNSGNISVDVRNYYTNDEGEVMPTSKGIRINSEMLLETMMAMVKCLEIVEVEDLKDSLEQLLDIDSLEADEDDPGFME